MSDQSGDSLGTVLVAGLMNLAIAAAKGVAGLLSGSAAMLSESAHSVADTITEVLLVIALRRGQRPSDEQHPFGYGRESYFWAFIAATFTFVVGGGFSITHGINEIVGKKDTGNHLLSYIVLAVSFGLEGISFIKGVRQARREAKPWHVSISTYLRLTPDTSLKAVVFEDTAALIGLLLAGAGLAAVELTGDPRYDGLASVLIGVLLIGVAATLAVANKSLLIGQSAPKQLRELIASELSGIDTVERVRQLYALHLGPDQIFVAAKVDFIDSYSAADIERAADRAEARLRSRFPDIRFVFLDPTPGQDESTQRNSG